MLSSMAIPDKRSLPDEFLATSVDARGSIRLPPPEPALMPHTLPVLPYELDALEPHISRQTLEFHHGKHHAAYVNNLNKLVEGTDLDGKSIEDTITAVAGNAEKAGVFNNAAQVWNHSFYWQCIKPGGGGQPTGPLAEKINADFGSFEKFIEAFKAAGATQFGSGWAWLVLDNGSLKVTKTANADLPLAHGQKALLTMDAVSYTHLTLLTT